VGPHLEQRNKRFRLGPEEVPTFQSAGKRDRDVMLNNQSNHLGAASALTSSTTESTDYKTALYLHLHFQRFKLYELYDIYESR